MKQQDIRVDVEALPEARWRKVDEAVFAAIEAGPSMVPPAPRRRPWIAVGVAIAAAAALVIYAKWPAPPAKPLAVVAPSHIETGTARSFVQLGFASIDVGPDSEVTTSGDEEHGVVVVLAHGSVDCEVAPRKDRPPFVVQSGNVRITVVGTHFTVTRSLTPNNTSVTVTHGIVDVSHDGTVTHVAAGESWPTLAREIIPTDPLPTATATASASPVVPSASLAFSRPAPSAAPKPPSEQDQFNQAQRLERSDPAQARTTYMRIANKGGPFASMSLYGAARLASDQGDSAEAHRLAQQYLDRYPTGLNADDARRILAH
jgi:hypothetical protein